MSYSFTAILHSDIKTYDIYLSTMLAQVCGKLHQSNQMPTQSISDSSMTSTNSQYT